MTGQLFEARRIFISLRENLSTAGRLDIRYLDGRIHTSTSAMWIATKIDEALPAIYFAVGAALIAGSLYIGLDSEAMLAYFILGSMCVGCSTVISDLRHMALSGQDRSRT